MSSAGALVLASRNEHKLRELAEILAPIPLERLPEGIELPPETGDTFLDNALIKARAAREATGSAVIADDSGICAEDLGGVPGVRSARYAGESATDEENLAKLLAEVGAAGGGRRVAYVCVIAFIDATGAEHHFEGRCEGTLAANPRGSGGFGYDPAFLPDEQGPPGLRTMAELDPADKHAISHRGRAGRALAEHLGVGASR